MHQNVKCKTKPKLTKGHNLRSIFRTYSKVNQVIYSLLPIYSSNFKALASTVFADNISFIFFQRVITQEKGHNPHKKKSVSYFVMRNPCMKFQNPSIQGSEVMLCTKRRKARTDE